MPGDPPFGQNFEPMVEDWGDGVSDGQSDRCSVMDKLDVVEMSAVDGWRGKQPLELAVVEGRFIGCHRQVSFKDWTVRPLPNCVDNSNRHPLFRAFPRHRVFVDPCLPFCLRE